jgi:hypothetical protein
VTITLLVLALSCRLGVCVLPTASGVTLAALGICVDARAILGITGILAAL